MAAHVRESMAGRPAPWCGTDLFEGGRTERQECTQAARQPGPRIGQVDDFVAFD